MDLDALWRSLPGRLAGSRPEHRLAHGRFAGGAAQQADPRLLALLPPEPRAAAVLVGMQDTLQGPGILLTVRAANMRVHAGQIAFPGGVIESSDAGPEGTALREAQEEVGLDPAHTQLLGFLPDQFVLTGFRITPVVAHLAAGFVPRLRAEEVQHSFVLPFATLMDPASSRLNQRRIAGFDVESLDLHYQEHRIWGATAGILLSLRELLQS